MVLSGEIIARIREVLEQHPEGISITDLVKSVDINRNTAGRYLENLLLSGQVEMRRFGMAKLYTLTKRLPVSSVLSLSSDLVLQLDAGQRVFYANDPLLRFLGVPAEDLFGKNIEFTRFLAVFEDVSDELLGRFSGGLSGKAWQGELTRPVQGRAFFCRITPAVSNEGKKGLTIILEDITDRKRDEELIRRSEARLRSIVKFSPVGIGVVSDRILREVNDRFCEMTGYSHDELVGSLTRMLYLSEEVFNTVGERYIQQIRRIGSSALETQWVKKNGTVIDILLNSTPIDPANISEGITFTAVDITVRNRALQASRESEERLQLALSGSETGMWEIDVPSMKGSIDERAAAILGYGKADIGKLSADWDTLTYPDDVPLIHQRLEDYLEGRTPIFESEHRMRHATGSWIWIVGRGKITHQSRDGSSRRITGTIQNITGRKKAEQALRESESTARALLNAPTDTVILLDNRGTILDLNETAVLRLGRPRGDLVGNLSDSVLPPDLAQNRRRKISEVLKSRKPVRFTDERRGIWFDNVVYPIPDNQGNVARLAIIARDITDQKRAEAALRESEERYRTLSEASQDLIFLIGRDDRVEYVNSYAAASRGLSAGQVIGQRRSSFFTGELEERQADILRQVFGTGKAQHSEGPMEVSGAQRWFDHYLMPITGTNGEVISVLGVSRDITDRKKAEQALRESEERYRRLVEISPNAVLLHQDGKIIYANPALARILGAENAQDLTGMNVMDLIHPAYRDVIRRNIADDLAGLSTPFMVLQMVRPDGTRVTVQGQGVGISVDGKPAVLVAIRDVPGRPGT